jgi:hypothetical protein
MANLTSSQIKDSYQSVLTTSETTSDPTTGTLQNGKGTAITALGVSGTVTATKLVPTGNVMAGNGMYLPATNVLAFSTNGGERVRIDASGNVGIGTASYTPKLAVSQLGATALAGYENPSGYNGRFEPSAIYGVARLGGGDLASNKDYAGVLGVGRVDAGGTPGAGHRIFGVLATESNGLGSDAKTFAFGAIGPSIFDGTVGVGVTPTSRNNTTLQIKDGIGFPATQVASSDPNTLDDYEEGTFDFGIAFGGSSVGVTYGSRQGKYTKIGNKVTVTGFIQLTNKGAEVGIATITGLPFAIGNSNANYSTPSIWFNNITFANQFQGFGEITDTKILLYEVTEAGALTNLTDGDFSNNSQIVVSFTYFVS